MLRGKQNFIFEVWRSFGKTGIVYPIAKQVGNGFDKKPKTEIGGWLRSVLNESEGKNNKLDNSPTIELKKIFKNDQDNKPKSEEEKKLVENLSKMIKQKKINYILSEELATVIPIQDANQPRKLTKQQIEHQLNEIVNALFVEKYYFIIKKIYYQFIEGKRTRLKVETFYQIFYAFVITNHNINEIEKIISDSIDKKQDYDLKIYELIIENYFKLNKLEEMNTYFEEVKAKKSTSTEKIYYCILNKMNENSATFKEKYEMYKEMKKLKVEIQNNYEIFYYLLKINLQHLTFEELENYCEIVHDYTEYYKANQSIKTTHPIEFYSNYLKKMLENEKDFHKIKEKMNKIATKLGSKSEKIHLLAKIIYYTKKQAPLEYEDLKNKKKKGKSKSEKINFLFLDDNEGNKSLVQFYKLYEQLNDEHLIIDEQETQKLFQQLESTFNEEIKDKTIYEYAKMIKINKKYRKNSIFQLFGDILKDNNIKDKINENLFISVLKSQANSSGNIQNIEYLYDLLTKNKFLDNESLTRFIQRSEIISLFFESFIRFNRPNLIFDFYNQIENSLSFVTDPNKQLPRFSPIKFSMEEEELEQIVTVNATSSSSHNAQNKSNKQRKKTEQDEASNNKKEVIKKIPFESILGYFFHSRNTHSLFYFYNIMKSFQIQPSPLCFFYLFTSLLLFKPKPLSNQQSSSFRFRPPSEHSQSSKTTQENTISSMINIGPSPLNSTNGSDIYSKEIHYLFKEMNDFGILVESTVFRLFQDLLEQNESLFSLFMKNIPSSLEYSLNNLNKSVLFLFIEVSSYLSSNKSIKLKYSKIYEYYLKLKSFLSQFHSIPFDENEIHLFNDKTHFSLIITSLLQLNFLSDAIFYYEKMIDSHFLLEFHPFDLLVKTIIKYDKIEYLHKLLPINLYTSDYAHIHHPSNSTNNSLPPLTHSPNLFPSSDHISNDPSNLSLGDPIASISSEKNRLFNKIIKYCYSHESLQEIKNYFDIMIHYHFLPDSQSISILFDLFNRFKDFYSLIKFYNYLIGTSREDFGRTQEINNISYFYFVLWPREHIHTYLIVHSNTINLVYILQSIEILQNNLHLENLYVNSATINGVFKNYIQNHNHTDIRNQYLSLKSNTHFIPNHTCFLNIFNYFRTKSPISQFDSEIIFYYYEMKFYKAFTPNICLLLISFFEKLNRKAELEEVQLFYSAVNEPIEEYDDNE